MRIILLIIILAFGCLYNAPSYAQSQRGKVSFYHEGQLTAWGETFNPHALTCAHRTLPRGTKVTVSYQGRSVVCTINDRGPYRKGRILDVSLGVARKLAMVNAGVIESSISW